MKYLSNIAVLIFTFAIVGCAGVPTKLTQESYNNVGTIGLNKDVTWNIDNPEYYSAGTNLGYAMGGILSQNISDKAAATKEEILSETMTTNNIDLANFALQKFVQQLNTSHDLKSKLTNKADPDTKFEVSVFRWGLRAPNPFSASLRPIIGVKVRLVQSDGTVVWQLLEQVTELNKDIPSYKFGEFLETPELLQSGYELAITTAMERIGKKLTISN